MALPPPCSSHLRPAASRSLSSTKPSPSLHAAPSFRHGSVRGPCPVSSSGAGRPPRPRRGRGSSAARRTRERTRSERLMPSASATSCAPVLSSGAMRTKSLSGYRSTSLTPLRSRRWPAQPAPEGSGGSPAARPARPRGAAAGGAPAGPGGCRGWAAGRCSWRRAHGTGYLLTQWLTSFSGLRSQLSRRGCAVRITARRASSFMACSLASGRPGSSGAFARVGSAT